jgi:hypothetical protein
MLVFMGPVSLIPGCQQMFGFASTVSMVGSGEKLGMDSQISQPACCGLYREPFFPVAVTM